VTTITIKQRWEWVEAALEVASIVGGILVAAGLWLEGWKGFGAKLVIVGVAIEVFVSGWVLLASRKLQALQERELEVMRLETAQAKQKQADAELQLERLKEHSRQRHIMRAPFLKKLEGRPKPTAVSIVYPRDDGEAYSLAWEIYGLLVEAKWRVDLPVPIKPKGEAPFSDLPLIMSASGSLHGVTVVTKVLSLPSDANTPYEILSDALCDALISGVSGNPDKSLPENVLRVVVGPREPFIR